MSSEPFDETVPAVEVHHSPARFSSIAAVIAGVVAVLASGLASIAALIVGAFGLAGVAAGLFVVDSRRLTTAGTGVIFLGVLASGLGEAATPAVLVFATLATVLTFDLGQNAFSVGAQLSDETDTTRGEVVHAAASLAAGAFIVVLAYGIYLLAAGGQPVAAVVFVLLAAVAIAWAIRA